MVETSRYNDWLASKLKDPVRAARYLNGAMQDSKEMFLKALRKVVSAQPRSVTELAEDIGVSRESLYRMTSEAGNPTYESLHGILVTLGLRLQIVPGEVSGTDPNPNKIPALAAACGNSATSEKSNRLGSIDTLEETAPQKLAGVVPIDSSPSFQRSEFGFLAKPSRGAAAAAKKAV
jgi:probable addiction module antidote protein